jgi:hypothetical protein
VTSKPEGDGELLSELLLRLRPHHLTLHTITFPSGLQLTLHGAAPEVLSPAEGGPSEEGEPKKSGLESRMRLP